MAVHQGRQSRRLPLRFDRMELSGAFGDLGTLLPMAIGMILVNGMDPSGVMVSIGLFYILSGLYFGVTVPVQPMKVIGAYAIATAMTAQQVLSAGLLMGIALLLIGATNAITVISRWIPKSVIRGVQLSTGILLMAQGVKLMMGSSPFQTLQSAAEPYLTIQAIGPIPVGIVLGLAAGCMALALLENTKLPAGIAVVGFGFLSGMFLGTHSEWSTLAPGFHPPRFLPFGWPSGGDLSFALVVLVAPQLPMTIGNAVVANADLSREYFADASARVTYRGLTVSMALANFASFFLGGIPLCHGAGGLATHYRFGARTAGSNLMVGAIFLLLGLGLGPSTVAVFHLLPLSVLGVLLLFGGSQLALTMMDLKNRKDMFVALTMLGVTLASNLAGGFVLGIALAHALRSDKLRV
ncbi:MAG: putative sulfate/molybdate transporter [Desulfobacterales bacterium]|jgi:SulP family sulfate permease